MRRIFVLAIIATCYFSIAEAAIVDKIVAVVNDEIITQAELNSALESAAGDSQVSKEKVLENLIVDKLVLSQAKRQQIEVSNKEVEERISVVKNRFPSDEAFLETLKMQDVTISHLKDIYKQQLMVKKLIDKEVNRKVRVSPSEVAEYYRKNLEQFKAPEAVKVSQIFIKVSPQNPDKEALKLADQIHKSLENGASFEALAKEYSQGPDAENGGSTGYVNRGQLKKEIEEVIFRLEVGQISEILKLENGYYIFKVWAKRPQRIQDLSEIQDEIKVIIFNQKAQKIFDEWVEKLKKDAYIRINEE